jgi:hypothetical protein
VAHVTTIVSVEPMASIITIERISELGELFLRSMFQLLVTANIPSTLILSTLIMEVIFSSEMSVLTIATWYHIPERYFYSHRRKNLNYYIA